MPVRCTLPNRDVLRRLAAPEALFAYSWHPISLELIDLLVLIGPTYAPITRTQRAQRV